MTVLGYLVRSPQNNLGIGKILAVSAPDVTVEYFCSVGKRIQKTLSLDAVAQVKLPRQTRCYIWLENQQTWVIGRIREWDEYSKKYAVDLPNSRTVLASEQQIYVRCNLPIDDPIETLAMKGHETPYFHNQRSRFVQSLIKQRAVSRGMTGLISANIQLYPHQVEVVRRVLEDPIQRYLLADEVGLGKTIEAGAILRQYLLDQPQGLALIIVPQYLFAQWQQELENKFYISYFGDRVKLLAVNDWEKVRSQVKSFDFLILDEAHHIAAMATDPDVKKRQCFDTCKQLAHHSDRLLLLSATPVLNHEQDFLTMLHLLDANTYHLDDLDGFRSRVQKRQEIGRVLLAFKEDADSLVLKNKLPELRKLFTEDQYLLTLTEQLQIQLDNQELSAQDSAQTVQKIRTHISDTYRLHRRMLRNRRTSTTVADVIFDRNAIPKAEYDLDERCYQIHELLEAWRTGANHPQYQPIFLLMFRASSTWLGILKQVVECRLNGFAHPELTQEFSAEDLRILSQTPQFNGEEKILNSILNIVQQDSEDGDRLELLKIILLYHLSEIMGLQSFRSKLDKLLEMVRTRITIDVAKQTLPKIVIFSSFVQTASEIYNFLTKTFGEKAVSNHQFGLSRQQVEKNLNKFKNDPQCFLLVCDASGEEGHNLQFVDGLIHFDLPLSPNRLEQRLGRIDRIGGKMQINSWLLAGVELPDSIQDAWCQLLKDGFGIFDQSIASLQFYVDEKLPELVTMLFEHGAQKLLESIPKIKADMQAENIKISEQNALDDIDAADELAKQYFVTLDDYDANHREIERATEGWICSGLNFMKINQENLAGVKRYKPTERTLISVDDLLKKFANYKQQSGTYNRRVANQNSRVNLYRLGEGFIDALADYIHWDDRGQAFAMWRHDQSWDNTEGKEWIGFRFDYIIETDFSALKQVVEDYGLKRFNYQALKRRADALFPPLWETVFLDAQMSMVEDENLLKILSRSYYVKSGNFIDYNLAKERLPILDQFIEPDKWADLCRNARVNSEQLWRERPAFIQLCQQIAVNATKKLENRVNQMRLRLSRLAQDNQINNRKLMEELEMESDLTEALIQGIRHPSIIPDSVGFIIVSGNSPM